MKITFHTQSIFRGRVGRSWSAGVPAVAGPGFLDEASGGDDRGGEGDERVDHAGADFGADLEFPEPASVPGVRSLHDPASSGLERLGLMHV